MNDICYIFECSYRTPSGYCSSTGGYAACQYRLVHFRDNLKNETNGDKYFRNATNEEIAERMAKQWNNCPVKYAGVGFMSGRCHMGCYQCWLDWLKQEVQE